MTSVSERFLRYVSFDTQSDPESPTCPSTEKQKVLGAALVEEMLERAITVLLSMKNTDLTYSLPTYSQILRRICSERKHRARWPSAVIVALVDARARREYFLERGKIAFPL